MNTNKYGSKIFNQAIQSKLRDDQWDNLIVRKIMYIRKEKIRRRFQLIIVPGILLTTSALFFMGNGNLYKASYLSNLLKRDSNSIKNSAEENKKINFKLHIMDAVFNRLQ